jgi:hypothetical protein
VGDPDGKPLRTLVIDPKRLSKDELAMLIAIQKAREST